MKRIITEKKLSEFGNYLTDRERSRHTVEKYLRDVRKLMDFADGREITKNLVMEFKEKLMSEGCYRISSINTFLIAANRFMEYTGWQDLKVRTYKVQKATFAQESRYITKGEYKRLVAAARSLGNIRLALLLNVLCATGIRISELECFTVESVRRGKIDIYNKGKARTILIPAQLQKKLRCYAMEKNITRGVIFRTRSGRPMERSNIWREMKALCGQAGVDEKKVFPHNLRHLFAQCFYSIKKDLAKLADILGHSSIETTRIYIRESSREHRRALEMMHLVC